MSQSRDFKKRLSTIIEKDTNFGTISWNTSIIYFLISATVLVSPRGPTGPLGPVSPFSPGGPIGPLSPS